MPAVRSTPAGPDGSPGYVPTNDRTKKTVAAAASRNPVARSPSSDTTAANPHGRACRIQRAELSAAGSTLDAMSDAQAVLLAAFAAAILTAVGSRLVAGYQTKRDAQQRKIDRDLQREESRRVDERNLRDAKRERLRGDYVAVTFAADNFLGASKQLGLLLAGDTPEARAERIQTQLEAATADLGRAMVRLRLEGGTQPVVDAYKRVQGHWFQYQWQVPDADLRHDHSQVLSTLQQMEAEVEGIVAGAKTDLDRLGEVI